MITLSASYGGSELGRELSDDLEECAQAFVNIASLSEAEIALLADEVGQLGEEESKKISVFLYKLAEAINNKD